MEEFNPGLGLFASAMVAGFLILISIIILAIFLLIYHIFISLGLYRMAVKSDLEKPWLAWIPLGNAYILGSIVKEIDFFGQRIINLGMLCVVLPVAVPLGIVVFGYVYSLGIPFISFIAILSILVVGVILLIFVVMLINKLFKIFLCKHAALYTLLSLLVPFAAPVSFMKAGNSCRIDISKSNNPLN